MPRQSELPLSGTSSRRFARPRLPRRAILAALLGFLLLGGVGLVWHHVHRAATVPPPPIPKDIADPAVTEALERARAALLANPRSAEAWGELGFVFRAHDIYPEAAACFIQAARLNPDDDRWPYLIALTNIYLCGEVIPYFQEAYRLATDPDRKTAARLRLAEAELESGELDRAEALFREQLRLTPNNAQLHLGLGLLALTREQNEDALQEFEKALGTTHPRQRLARLLATTHRRLGHPEQADLYEKLSITAPADPGWSDPFQAEYLAHRVGRRALNERVNELESRGQFWEAVSVCEQLAQTYADEPSLVTFGKILARAGALDRSELVLRETLKKNQNSVAAHFFLGRTLMLKAEEFRKKGNKIESTRLDEQAVVEFRNCIQLKVGHGPAFVELGRALQRLGRDQEAIETCLEAVQISSHAAEAHLALGEVLIAAGKTREAIPPLEEAVRLSSPRDGRARSLLQQITPQ
jgi:tetratricopeptide (TPR) repeat protein